MSTIYHNPRCRKSRETLQLLEAHGQQPQIVLYLEQPPTAAELQDLLHKLGMEPMQLIRKGEAVWKEQFKGKTLSNKELIQAMIAHPKLIERPIVVNGDKAALGRPPEQVLAIF